MKKSILYVLIAVLIAAAAAASRYGLPGQARNTPDTAALLEGSEKTDVERPSGTGSEASSEKTADNTQEAAAGNPSQASSTAGAADKAENTILTEIDVIGNSPEYDLKCYLTRDAAGSLFIRLEYYYEGAGETKELGADQVPELKYVPSEPGTAYSRPGRRIKAAYLNPVNSRVYIVAEGNTLQDFVETSIYSYTFRDNSLKKIFSKLARLGGLSFTKDFKYLGFSWNDSPASSVFKESTLLELLDCRNDVFRIKGSRDAKGAMAGGIKEDGKIHDFEFLGWYSNTAARIKETYPSGDPAPKTGSGRELLYDVEKNVFLNTDGSPLADAAGKPDIKPDSEPLKTLKSFYAYIADKEGYSKAMDLLAPDFRLKLGLMKQFGIEEATKEDIVSNMNDDNISLYGQILSMAKIDGIAGEETTKSEATIYYYQVFAADGRAEGRQPLVAKLALNKGRWELKSVVDGSADQAPFNKQ